MLRPYINWITSIPKLVIFGIVFTFFYFGYLIHIYGNQLTTLKTMPLNEVGDFLAGVFGPVGFLWLVFGYFMQASEISATRRSIARQEKEREIAAQPIMGFSCEYGQLTVEEKTNPKQHVNEHCIAFSIQNHGAIATNLTIKHEYFSIHVDVLNSRAQFQTTFTRELNSFPRIKISYTDALGLAREREYLIIGFEKEWRNEPFDFSPSEYGPLPDRRYKSFSLKLITEKTFIK